MLGLASRSGNIKLGDDAYSALASNEAHLLLISNEASDRTFKQLSDRCDYYKVDYNRIDDVVLNQAIGKFNKRYVLVTDEGFAKSIKEILRKR